MRGSQRQLLVCDAMVPIQSAYCVSQWWVASPAPDLLYDVIWLRFDCVLRLVNVCNPGARAACVSIVALGWRCVIDPFCFLAVYGTCSRGLVVSRLVRVGVTLLLLALGLCCLCDLCTCAPFVGMVRKRQKQRLCSCVRVWSRCVGSGGVQTHACGQVASGFAQLFVRVCRRHRILGLARQGWHRRPQRAQPRWQCGPSAFLATLIASTRRAQHGHGARVESKGAQGR